MKCIHTANFITPNENKACKAHFLAACLLGLDGCY